MPGREDDFSLARFVFSILFAKKKCAIAGSRKLAGADNKGELNQQRREIPMEQVAGVCRKIGEKWCAIEFKEKQLEMAVPPSPSKSSSPPSATRRSKLFT